MPKQNLSFFSLTKSDYLFELLKDNEFLSDEEENLISAKLNSQVELLAYFLYKSTLLPSNKMKIIINKLISLEAFNKMTINQFITQNILNIQKNYSTSYLLLSNAEGREILKENLQLCDLIGKELSEDLLNQFVDKNTHEGTLYYLLTDELGLQILKEHSSLQEKISQIDKSDTTLSKQIVDGPDKGKSLKHFYELFLNSSKQTDTISPSFM